MAATPRTSSVPVEIIRPNGEPERPERRHGALSFRPYARGEARPSAPPAVSAERRRRRRSGGEDRRGRRIDIVS